MIVVILMCQNNEFADFDKTSQRLYHCLQGYVQRMYSMNINHKQIIDQTHKEENQYFIKSHSVLHKT